VPDSSFVVDEKSTRSSGSNINPKPKHYRRTFRCTAERCKEGNSNSLHRKRSPPMQSEQQLNQSVGNQLVQREQFLIGLMNRAAIRSGLDP